MNGPQQPHGRGTGLAWVGACLLALYLVGPLSAAAPGNPLQPFEHGLQMGNLRQSLPGERRGIHLPPSVIFMARPPYLDAQDLLAAVDIALLGGARVTPTTGIDYATGRITLLGHDADPTPRPHVFRTGDKVEVIATGSAPRGLTARRAGEAARAYYFVRTDGSDHFYLHKREADAYRERQTLIPLPPAARQGAKPGILYFVPKALERRRPPIDELATSEPAWEGILRQLKRVLESDATTAIKQEAKGTAMISLALRAQIEGDHVEAHRLWDYYARTHFKLPNPPVSIPEVLLLQARLHRLDNEHPKALAKFYDAQKSLLARPASDERLWQWLNLQAKRGIADTLFQDQGGFTEDTRQWARKMGAAEMERTHLASADAARNVFENVVKTRRPHGLQTGNRVRLMPMNTTHAIAGIRRELSLYVKTVDDGQGDKFILLDNLEDTRNPFRRRGLLPNTPNTGKLFFLPYSAPASKLVEAARPDRYTDEQLGQRVYPRLVRLFAGAQLYGQLDTEVDDLQRVFGNLNNTLFAGPRGMDVQAWRAEWRRWSTLGSGKANIDALATALPNLLKTPAKLEADAAAAVQAERDQVRQAGQPAKDENAWQVVFDHMHDIFTNNSVPVSGIRIDLPRDVLTKKQHGLRTGDPVRFSGPLPIADNVKDLDNSSIMFVRANTLDEFSLHPSASEAANGINNIDFNGAAKHPFVTLVGIPHQESTVGQALMNLAQTAEREDEFGEALQYLSEYIARNPDSPMVPEILLRQGYLYRLMGQPGLATEKLYETMTDAIRLRSRNLLKYRRVTLMAQAQIADLHYTDLRQYDDAIKYYGQLLNDPDEELHLENTKYKLIRCLVRRAMELRTQAADPAKRRDNPLLAGQHRDRLTTLVRQATRFLVDHPRSPYRAQVRYLRAQAYEKLGDEKNADKDYRTLIETPDSEDPSESSRWNFWKTKAALDLADRMFDRKSYADAVRVYPVLLPHNPTLDAHLRIQQQIALCQSHLGNLLEETAAWERIGQLWRQQQQRLKDQQDILTVLEQQAEDLKDAELAAQLERIEQQKKIIGETRATLTPRLELIQHMAGARLRALHFRKQFVSPAAPAPNTVANTQQP
tara:strand:- start:4322 stop:7627 length:3306 start_codon:yes stop_codon:yes gene_type:complete